MKKGYIKIRDTAEAYNAMCKECVSPTVAGAIAGGIFKVILGLSEANINGWLIPRSAYTILRNYGKTKSRKS